MKKKKKGFTLIELVVVLVIIGILSIIAVPMYRGYVGRAMAAEGRALLGAVASSEKIYYAEHGGYWNVSLTNHDLELDVDASLNTYFREYQVTVTNPDANGNNQGFLAETDGDTTSGANGILIDFDQDPNLAPVLTITYP